MAFGKIPSAAIGAIKASKGKITSSARNKGQRGAQMSANKPQSASFGIGKARVNLTRRGY